MLYWRGLPGPPLQVDSDGTGVLLVSSTQYVNNMACSWTFTPPPGRYVKVTFLSFNVSTTKEVQDLASCRDPQLFKFLCSGSDICALATMMATC